MSLFGSRTLRFLVDCMLYLRYLGSVEPGMSLRGQDTEFVSMQSEFPSTLIADRSTKYISLHPHQEPPLFPTVSKKVERTTIPTFSAARAHHQPRQADRPETAIICLGREQHPNRDEEHSQPRASTCLNVSPASPQRAANLRTYQLGGIAMKEIRLSDGESDVRSVGVPSS